MKPFAPPRLSTTIGTPSSSVIFGAMLRAVMSDGPPGAKGMTMRIGLFGNCCAFSAAERVSARSAAAAEVRRYIFPPCHELHHCNPTLSSTSLLVTGNLSQSRGSTLDLQVRRFDDAVPAFGFLVHVGEQLARRARLRLRAELNQPLCERRIRDHLHDLGIEFRHDGGRRFRGREHRVPVDAFETR